MGCCRKYGRGKIAYVELYDKEAILLVPIESGILIKMLYLHGHPYIFLFLSNSFTSVQKTYLVIETICILETISDIMNSSVLNLIDFGTLSFCASNVK